MKMKLKLVVFLGVSLFLILVFSTFLLPSEGQVTDSITIYASDSVVKSKLTNYQSYVHWFPWTDGEPADIKYLKNDDTHQIKGFSFIGKGEKQGNKGRFLMKNTEGDSIYHYLLKFENMPNFYGVFLLKGNEEQTVLAWKLNMHAGWTPWWRFYASMMSKITKPALTNGLSHLKKLCENK